MKNQRKILLAWIVLVQIACLPLTLLGQSKDTSTYLTINDKKVVRLIINDLKNCEENSKDKDTIIRDMTIRYMIKDSAHLDSKKEVNRLKLENKSLAVKLTDSNNKLGKRTNALLIVTIIAVLQTIIIIKLI